MARGGGLKVRGRALSGRGGLRVRGEGLPQYHLYVILMKNESFQSY